jgi:hypothetical protein
MLYESEISFIQKIMPKGYCLLTTAAVNRNKPTKGQVPAPAIVEQMKIEQKEDLLNKRAQRITKEKPQPPPLVYNPPKPLKAVSDVLKKCQSKLALLQKHKMAEPFLVPVDWQTLRIPDYPTIVKEPMDLSTVEKKLKSGAYLSSSQFAADVRKIWANAILYNPRTSPIFTMTQAMSDYFEQIFQDVEDAPLQDQTIDQIHKKAVKVEKKIEEVKLKGIGLETDQLDKPMTFEEKKQLFLMIKSTKLLPRLAISVSDRH